MTWIYILVVAVLGLQITLFIIGRRIKRKEKESNVLLKYNIDTRQKAWQLLADPTIPEEDKEKIQELYDAQD